MNEELQKNLWKGIVIAIFVIGGIGPFTFLKGCFRSEKRIIPSYTTNIPTSSIESSASSNSSENSYGDYTMDDEQQTHATDDIIIRDFSHIGTYDYLGNDAELDGDMMDLNLEINLSKKEVVCNGSYSELNGNEFNYAGTRYRLSSSNGELYNHLVGEAPNGMLYFHYEATNL